MENIFNYVKNIIYKYYIFMFMILLLILFIFEFVFFSYKINVVKQEYKEKSSIQESNVQEDSSDTIEEENISVDIKGMVNKPGVYKVMVGSRISDLIEKAGGLKKDANTRYINLSKVLVDEDVIIINSNSEINDALKNEEIKCEPCICDEMKNNACIDNKNETSENKSSLVNINTAGLSELISLDGIGEAKANAIIEYRENNGKFKSINDIVNVDGISETIFNKIKENITV